MYACISLDEKQNQNDCMRAPSLSLFIHRTKIVDFGLCLGMKEKKKEREGGENGSAGSRERK